MKNLYKGAIFVFIFVLAMNIQAQDKYFSLRLTDTTAWSWTGNTTNKPVAAGPWTEVSVPDSFGTWKIYGVYYTSGPTGLCTATNTHELRFYKDGTSSTVSYIITPTLLRGVGTVSIQEGQAKALKHEVFYSKDNGSTWTSAGLITSTTTACQIQSLSVNQSTANRVKVTNASGTAGDMNINLIEVTSTTSSSDVKAEASTNVTSYKLGNYPNPFNPSTKIAFEMPQSSNINLSVFNMLGEKVATLHEGYVPSGAYSTQFNASNLPSGMYIVRLQAEKTSLSKKIMLMK